MKIFFDMDGCLVDLVPAWLRLYNEATGENLEYKNLDCFRWTSKTKYPKICELYMQIPGFFGPQLPPIENAVETIKEIVEQHTNVYLLTTPYAKSETCERDKRRWVEHYLPFFNVKNIIFSHYKHECAGRNKILIDDKVQNLEEWERAGGISICFDQPWNQHYNGEHRVKGWIPALFLIQRLYDEKIK